MRRLRSDNRPRWDDPDLPCIRNYRMRDGSVKVEVEADYEHRYREFMVETSIEAGWRDDPTYDLRRR